MRKWQRNNIQISDCKWAFDQSLFRNKITSRPGAVMKSIREHPRKILHRHLIRIDGQASAPSQVAEPSAIVQAHDMVRMRMREKDGIQPTDVFTQHLDAEF